LSGIIATNKTDLETKMNQFSIQMNLLRKEKEEIANQTKKLNIVNSLNSDYFFGICFKFDNIFNLIKGKKHSDQQM